MAYRNENQIKLSISSKENTMHFLVNYLVSDMCPPMLIYWEGMISAHKGRIRPFYRQPWTSSILDGRS